MVRMIPNVEEQENARMVPARGLNAMTIKRDFVPPIPEGSYIACIFRVGPWTPDCDGQAMTVLTCVDKDGEETGGTMGPVSLYQESDVLLDGPGDLHEIAEVTSAG